MFIKISETISHVDLSGLRAHIGEAIVYMGELVDIDILGVMLAAVDSLRSLVSLMPRWERRYLPS